MKVLSFLLNPKIKQNKMIWTLIILIVGISLEAKFSPRIVIKNDKVNLSYKDKQRMRVYKQLW